MVVTARCGRGRGGEANPDIVPIIARGTLDFMVKLAERLSISMMGDPAEVLLRAPNVNCEREMVGGSLLRSKPVISETGLTDQERCPAKNNDFSKLPNQ